MATRGLTDEANYQAIADAIREKTGGTDTYTPAEMAGAVRALSGSAYPVMEVPEEYLEYVQYAAGNLYTGSYDHLAVLDREDEISVAFLMPEFVILEFDEATGEFNASGWVCCTYVKASGEWTISDMRETAGSSYARNIVYASCPIVYGAQTLFPLPIYTECDITGVNMDNFENGSFTVTYASGNSEEITLLYDDSGAVVGVQDSLGNQVTVEGVSV